MCVEIVTEIGGGKAQMPNNEIYVCYGDYGYEGKTAPCYVGPSLEDCIKAGFKSNYSDIKIDVWSDGVFSRSLNVRN